MKKLTVFLSLALLLGLADMPYGYYMLLRFCVALAFVYLAVETYERNESAKTWTSVGIALVYQPFFKLGLPREVWAIINLGTIAALCWIALALAFSNIDDKK